MFIIGGDRRMIFAAAKLAERYNAVLYGFENAGITGLPRAGGKTRSDCAVLPVFAGTEDIVCPYGDGDLHIEELCGLLRPGAVVFAGKVFPRLSTLCSENGWELYDYLEREELAVMNAVLTAEAAAALAVNETERSVFGAEVLVLGFGRIGRLAARYFAALGARVTAAARKPGDLARIRVCGYTPADIRDGEALAGALAAADIILNTVPAPVLAGGKAAAGRSDAVLIELASVPCTDGGAPFRVIRAGGLPGKTAPVTAGYIIAEAVENILDERSGKNGGA